MSIPASSTKDSGHTFKGVPAVFSPSPTIQSPTQRLPCVTNFPTLSHIPLALIMALIIEIT